MSPRSAPASEPKRADLLRQIPSVERILSSAAGEEAAREVGRTRLRDALRGVLDELRGSRPERLPSIAELVAASTSRALLPLEGSLRRVINATGVIIHTNLGRSPVDPRILERTGELLRGYTNLELDLETGSRGRRHTHLSAICRELFGAEAALLVNNNAAGILLVLAALAREREVIVSRGELVEIGGSFRVPDVIEQGGARLREVGTTNRTRASDYERAIGRSTGALLRVHRSNFEIVGFTEMPEVGDLVSVARKHELPLVIDEGSGRIVDMSRYGFAPEPTVRELLESGADVVTCSTDKLIGGLQGGLILGRADLLERCAKHPLMRAFRPGKESFATTQATLEAFASDRFEELIPIYRMLATPLERLRERAAAIAQAAGGEIVESRSLLGGGTTPAQSVRSVAVRFSDDATRLHRRLLDGDPPVVARIEDQALLLDLRTVAEDEDPLVISALAG